MRPILLAAIFVGVLLAAIMPAIASDSSSAPRLFASPETRQALGAMAAYIPQWAEMDVLVVSPEDLTRRNIRNPQASFERYARTVTGFPFARLERERLKESLVRSAANANAHAFPLPARTSGERPVCAITLPDMNVRSSTLISRIAEVAGADADFIPGTDQEWLLITVAHEIGHCQHSYDDQRASVALRFEREADQYAINIYREFAPRILGPIENLSAVPSALIALRGIAGMHSNFIHHSTSPGLTIDGTAPRETDSIALGEAKHKARKAVWSMARTGVPDREKEVRRRPGARQLYQAARTLYVQGYFNDTPLQKRYIETFLEGAERFFPSYYRIKPHTIPASSGGVVLVGG